MTYFWLCLLETQVLIDILAIYKAQPLRVFCDTYNLNLAALMFRGGGGAFQRGDIFCLFYDHLFSNIPKFVHIIGFFHLLCITFITRATGEGYLGDVSVDN